MTEPREFNARRQMNDLCRDVATIKADVQRILAALELQPHLEDQMQRAQRSQRERHQRPTCETCNSVGMVETSAGAIPCEECER